MIHTDGVTTIAHRQSDAEILESLPDVPVLEGKRLDKKGRYTVTGPRADGRTYHDKGTALSFAITLALRASKDLVSETYYVRDEEQDRIVSHAECDEHGVVFCRGESR